MELEKLLRKPVYQYDVLLYTSWLERKEPKFRILGNYVIGNVYFCPHLINISCAIRLACPRCRVLIIWLTSLHLRSTRSEYRIQEERCPLMCGLYYLYKPYTRKYAETCDDQTGYIMKETNSFVNLCWRLYADKRSRIAKIS